MNLALSFADTLLLLNHGQIERCCGLKEFDLSLLDKLYSMDGKNKCHIDLGRLPLTVGKLAGAVDMVIDEKSVSRMHAKFSRTENNVDITDLNSTNGTFRNGMRLLPNASERIEPGDEIRLGKLKFIYR